ncbi:hypothetical protein PV327_004203 [Microctonus hyperodae]|uniref:Cytochrome P450 n=1 Tax=Microctonus hyperodae TaxID=165561 RepID=A0AA39FBW7_MICHY|nr:hypothetical protein PV327_004203 [Microctonus hyperodae]
MGFFGDSIILRYIVSVLEHTIVTFLTILVISFVYYFFQKKFFTINGIPHEKPSRIFGNMMQPCFGTVSFVERLKIHYSMDNVARYMGFYDFNNPIILVRSPDIAEQILVKHYTAFVDHSDSYETIHDALFRTNSYSLKYRKGSKFSRYFHELFKAPNMEATLFPLILKRSKNLIEYIKGHTENGKITMNSKDIFSRYINDVFSSCGFGIDNSDAINNPDDLFYKLAVDALTFKGLKLYKFFFMRTYPSIADYFRMNLTDDRVREFFTTVVRDIIGIREVNPSKRRRDMIEIMMEAKFQNELNETSPEITIEDITAQAFGFYLNGFDSTSSLLCFATHLLSINEKAQVKLYEEVMEVYGKFQEEPTYEAIDNMKYLDAVVCETLRLYPITPYIERVCTKHVDFVPSLPRGKKYCYVDPGTSVWIPTYAFQNDSHFYPYPRIFRPERFIGRNLFLLRSIRHV